MPNIKMFFKSNKTEIKKEDSSKTQDLAIITQMNQEFATKIVKNLVRKLQIDEGRLLDWPTKVVALW